MELLDFCNPNPIDHTPVYGVQEDHPLHYFWRVDSCYSWNSDGSCSPSIHFSKWWILRRTAKGVWLIYDSPDRRQYLAAAALAERDKKIVYLNARRAWAYPTKAEAWDSFLIRQSKRVQHCKNRLEAAESICALAKGVNQDTYKFEELSDD